MINDFVCPCHACDKSLNMLRQFAQAPVNKTIPRNINCIFIGHFGLPTAGSSESETETKVIRCQPNIVV